MLAAYFRLHRADILLSNKYVLCLQDGIRVYGTAEAVKKNVFVTDLSKAWDKVLQQKGDMLSLSCFAERRAEV